MSDVHIPDEATRAFLDASNRATSIGTAYMDGLRAAAPLIVAAAYDKLAERWRPIREEMRDVDGRSFRSSALGVAIADVERGAAELRGERMAQHE